MFSIFLASETVAIVVYFYYFDVQTFNALTEIHCSTDTLGPSSWKNPKQPRPFWQRSKPSGKRRRLPRQQGMSIKIDYHPSRQHSTARNRHVCPQSSALDSGECSGAESEYWCWKCCWCWCRYCADTYGRHGAAPKMRSIKDDVHRPHFVLR
jgi:hypothetical protein